ncbi:MAG TPA: hypothetical protein VIP80_01585 [Gemmatimonadales bacterium]|jgi:uncharacterized membrane protein
MLILLRLIHIAGGVFWAGTMLFAAVFLEPSVREAGPDGAKVMLGLMRRKYMVVMPIVAALTILAGVGLLEQVSGGFHPDWMSSPTGITLSLGAAIAILAFLIGIFFVRPAAMRLAVLMPQMMQSPEGQAREVLMAEAQGLRTRLRRGGRVVAALLGVTTIAMAVARYL